MDPSSSTSLIAPAIVKHSNRSKEKKAARKLARATAIAVASNDPNGNAEASSSKQPNGPVVTIVPVDAESQPIKEPGEKKKKRNKDTVKQELRRLALLEEGKRTADEQGEVKSKSKGKRKDKRKGEGQGGVVQQEEEINENEWECVPLAQSQVSRVPPIWTRDGRFYITAQSSSILVNSATAPYERRSTLTPTESKYSSGRITALLRSPVHSSHIVSASEDGIVRVWDVESGRNVYTVHVNGTSLRQMCFGQIGGKWEVFVTCSSTQTSGRSKSKSTTISSRIVHFALPTAQNPKPEIYRLTKLSSLPTALFISPSSTYLVALAANKAYTFLLPSSPSTPDWTAQLVKFVSDQPLTCGAFAPVNKLSKGEEWFATGDETGVIRLWHGLGQAFRLLEGGRAGGGVGGEKGKGKGGSGHSQDKEAERRLPTTSLHWHAHAVAAVAFTPSGSQLLSVGEESVLVQWHIGSGRREYIPRLGGRPITSLAVKDSARGVEEEWWMAFADGSVVKVGAGSGKIENVGDGVKIDPLRLINPNAPYPLALHPSTSSLVLPSSNPGTLQFIDPSQTSLLFDLEVAPSNRVSRKDDKEIVPVAVELVAFSSAVQGKSEWMATVEGREGDECEGGGEVRNLKIWRWDGQRYIVNTQFPRPHGLSHITALAFSPLGTPTSPATPYLLTTADDGSAKLWQLRQAKKSEHGKAASKRPAVYEQYWSARSNWTYRSLPIYTAAFSPDSTIIALAHGSVLSLWHTESNVFLRALSCESSSTRSDFRLVAFSGEEGRYLAVAGSAGLICWDLLSCERQWTVPKRKISALLVLPSGDFLTSEIISSQTVISTFSPSSSFAPDTAAVPTRSITVREPIRSLVHLPTASSRSIPLLNFAAVSTQGEIFRLGDRVSSTSPISARLTAPNEKPKLSIWQEMFGQHAFVDPSVDTSDLAESSSNSPQTRHTITGRPSAVYDGPSHTLPPASMLFDGFMEEILASSAPVSDHEEKQEEGLLYEQDDVREEQSLLLDQPRARTVGKDEIRELEVFFADLLGLSSGSEKVKTNGDKGTGRHALLNGSSRDIAESEDDEDNSEEPEVNQTTLANGRQAKTNTPAKRSQKADTVLEVEEDRVVTTSAEVSGANGSAAKKGKKRRAPKDAE